LFLHSTVDDETLDGRLNFSPLIIILFLTRMRSTALIACVLLLLSCALSCDGGLAPPSLIEPGFGGTISFTSGTWPPPDSLVNLWLVASQDYPLDSVTVFTGIFSNPPRIYVYPSLDTNLPFNIDTVSYSFLLPPANYKYIAVIQRFKNEINARALRVVGLYGTATIPPEPISVSVRDFEFMKNINIVVNFHNPPPQPF